MVKKDKMGWSFCTHGEKKNARRISSGKPEEIRVLGRPGNRREDDIKIYLQVV
jgi:hypothetical protein